MVTMVHFIKANKNQHFYYWIRVLNEREQEESKLTAADVSSIARHQAKIRQAYKNLTLENGSKSIFKS